MFGLCTAAGERRTGARWTGARAAGDGELTILREPNEEADGPRDGRGVETLGESVWRWMTAVGDVVVREPGVSVSGEVVVASGRGL